MSQELLLQELEGLSARMGLVVRYENGNFSDSFCRLKEDKFLFIHKKIPTEKKVRVLARELSKFDSSGHFVLPVVREILDKYREESN